MGLSGYLFAAHGQASFARARELARASGLAGQGEMDALAGESIAIDLAAEGPWLVPEAAAFNAAVAAPGAGPDRLTGTVTLRNANWKADYLANHVEIAQATLHLDNGAARWDPVQFSYGPLKGTATLTLPPPCDAAQPCAPPGFTLQFGALDAATIEAAILGAHEPGTMLSTLIARFTPASTPAWPRLVGTIKADSLVIGPVTLEQPSATLRILETGAQIADLGAALLGGRVHASGTIEAAGAAGPDGKPSDKPVYTLEGEFTHVNPAAVGELLGQRWSGAQSTARARSI